MRTLVLALLLAIGLHARKPATGDLMRSSIEKQRASVALQREAVRKQAETAVISRPVSPAAGAIEPAEPGYTGSPPAAPALPCDPIAEEVLTPLIESAARAQELQPALLRAVIGQESAFRPCAVSRKGARGLMQLMPGTALELGVRDSFDPKENVDAGARYLKVLLDRYGGDLPQALGAYNAGPASVDEAGGVPDFPETRDYVGAILRALAR